MKRVHVLVLSWGSKREVKVRFKLQIVFFLFSRFLKMNVKVESEGNKAVVSIPAFTFHEFDRTGKV